MKLIKTKRNGRKVEVEISDAHAKEVLKKDQFSLPDGIKEADIPEVKEVVAVKIDKTQTPSGLMRLRVDDLLALAKKVTGQEFPGSTPKADLVELIIKKQEESTEE